jgi:hypothetical protein
MRATYSPEDNKLRLYADGRLDNETYQRVKSAGFKWAPKQELFVAPSWSPSREDLLLELCDEIEDEDYSPTERAADRAERFEGYRDRRLGEAVGHADNFDSGPGVFGHQNAVRAERAAARHDRQRYHAVSQWSKAEYWQQRTKGVISHALHQANPRVRRGRIKVLETDLRKCISAYTPADDPPHITIQDGEPYVWVGPKGRGGRWVKQANLPKIEAGYRRWVEHYDNRLSYERAMLANEGGTAADVEMIPGGWLGNHQIHAVNKSPVTGKVVSVKLLAPRPWWREPGPAPLTMQSFNIERFPEDAYRAPTDEELAAFKEATKKRKANEKASKPKEPPLINPTIEDAQRLQMVLNAEAHAKWLSYFERKGQKPYRDWINSEVLQMTQEVYSSNSRGDYSLLKIHVIAGVRVRTRFWSGNNFSADPRRIIVITDKPQKPLPIDWDKIEQQGQLTSS